MRISDPKHTEYLFTDDLLGARRRLTVMEEANDRTTIGRLARLGPARGWRCLEAGAGGGSIAQWLADQVGPDGHVTALDLSTTALADLESDTLTVQQADLRKQPPPRDTFDLIHTRLVLGHIPEREQILDDLIAALRPGGHLVLEEADRFTSSWPVGPALHTDVMNAALDAIEQAGADTRWGRKLPALYQDRGLIDIQIDYQLPVHEGGTAGLEWLRITFDQMNAGPFGLLLDEGRYAQWRQLTRNPGQWFAGLGLVGAWGRRPGQRDLRA
jgi:SAM-dependent methyltransferase